MSVRDEQLWVIEGRSLRANSLVSERYQEGYQVIFLLLCQLQVPDVRVLVGTVVEVAAAIVELNHLLQGQLPAVVEVGSSKFYVPQSRHLKTPICDHWLVRAD
jgi:hypothetical protein